MAKMKIIRVHRDESDICFVIRFPKGKTILDIQDIKFLVKEKDDTALPSAIITKTKSGGDITLSGKDVAKVKMNVSNYNNIVIGNLYRSALFVKWTGNTDFDENVKYLFDFQTKQNFDNDN